MRGHWRASGCISGGRTSQRALGIAGDGVAGYFIAALFRGLGLAPWRATALRAVQDISQARIYRIMEPRSGNWS